VEDNGFAPNFQQYNDNQSNTIADNKVRTKSRTFSKLDIGSLVQRPMNYTPPKILPIYKGRANDKTAKAIHAAKDWRLEYYFEGSRIKLSDGLNKIKDFDTKVKAFEILRATISQLLTEGYNPLFGGNDNLITNDAPNDVITVTIAVETYLKVLRETKMRPKTISSYKSKLTYLVDRYGNMDIKDVTPFDVTYLIDILAANNNWANRTYNSCKIAWNGLFKMYRRKRIISENPTTEILNRALERTTKHTIFNNEDKERLKASFENDRYTKLFTSFIYHSHIRPKELRTLQVKDIDLVSGVITIGKDKSKNKCNGKIAITEAIRAIITDIGIGGVDGNAYVFGGNSKQIWGLKQVGTNTPYQRYMRHIDRLGLGGKEYTLYSFKHYGNVIKYKEGYTSDRLAALNRHSNINETETYLKELLLIDGEKNITPW